MNFEQIVKGISKKKPFWKEGVLDILVDSLQYST